MEDSPGDQEIFSWWGRAGDIYFVFHAVDSLIGNLWIHFLKSIDFIERIGDITKRPGDFLLVGWGLEYFFCVPCTWWFDWKSMKYLSKIFLLYRFGGFTRSPEEFLLVRSSYTVDDLIRNLWKLYSRNLWKLYSRNLWKLFSRNLWKLYSKYFNFIKRFSGFTRRPGDFLLVGWGLRYLCLRIYFNQGLTLEPLDGF